MQDALQLCLWLHRDLILVPSFVGHFVGRLSTRIVFHNQSYPKQRKLQSNKIEKMKLEKNNVCLIFMNILRPTRNSGVSCHWFPPKIFGVLTWDMELPFPFCLFPSSPHDQIFCGMLFKFLFHFSRNYRLKGWVPWETTQAWSKEFLDPSSPSKGHANFNF
jgi:hypothetical protein